jgi:hypothetical protein
MRRATATVLTLLAASWAGRLAAQVPIREIRLTLDPATYNGPCPARLRAHIVFVSNYPARVDEDNWGWNFGRLAPHSWDVPGGHLRTTGLETVIDTTLTLPRAGETGGLLHEGSVHVIMELSPTISNTVRYSVRCAPSVTIDPNLLKPVTPGPALTLQTPPKLPPPAGGSAGPAVHLPDLVVSRLDPLAGILAVRNAGDAAAPASEVLLRVLCVRPDGGAEPCIAPAGLPAAAPPPAVSDPARGGWIFPVPALAPGAEHTLNVPGWGAIKWSAGKYEMGATADPRARVAERSEANNGRTARFAKP